jgi:hypothetical protein
MSEVIISGVKAGRSTELYDLFFSIATANLTNNRELSQRKETLRFSDNAIMAVLAISESSLNQEGNCYDVNGNGNNNFKHGSYLLLLQNKAMLAPN